MEEDFAFENYTLAETAASSLARFLLISSNGTYTFFSFPGSSTKYWLNAATWPLLISPILGFTAFAIFTLYHAAYFGSSSTGRRRTTRDVPELEGPDLHFGEFETVPTDFAALYSLDSNWCALRLACELAARASAGLSVEERNLMKYFRSVVTQPDLRKVSAPQLYYSYASYIGFDSGRPDKCREHYPKCPFNSKKMLEIYTSGKTTGTKSQLRKELDEYRQRSGSFGGRYLHVEGRGRGFDSLTDYEKKRRQARRDRVQYLIDRRQSIIDKRKNNRNVTEEKKGPGLEDVELNHSWPDYEDRSVPDDQLTGV